MSVRHDQTSELQVLRRVNFPATLMVTLESSFGYIYWAYAVALLGSPSAANATLSVFWLAVLFAELPTGWLLDRIGPKKSLIIASSARIGAFLLFWLAAKQPGWIWPANIIAGAAVSLLSGLFFLQIRLESNVAGRAVNLETVSRSITFVRGTGLLVGTFVGFLALRLSNAATVWLISAVISMVMMTVVVVSWSDLRDCNNTKVYSPWRSFAVNRSFIGAVLRLSVWRACIIIFVSNVVSILVPNLDASPVALMLFYLVGGAFTIVASYLRVTELRSFLGFGAPLFLLVIPAAARLASEPHWVLWVAYSGGLLLANLVEQILRARFFATLPKSNVGTTTSMQTLLANLLTAAGFSVASVATPHIGVSGICLILSALMLGVLLVHIPETAN